DLYGNIELLKPYHKDTNIISRFVENGYLEMLSNYNITSLKEIYYIVVAVENNHVDILNYLYLLMFTDQSISTKFSHDLYKLTITTFDFLLKHNIITNLEEYIQSDKVEILKSNPELYNHLIELNLI